ncbi:MAG: hypothetical protein PXX77_11600, partial [Gallionella sp.]|nr:hypothetical protein [Gallionella sp.]
HMKIFLYLTTAFWITLGLAIYFDVSFTLRLINSGLLLIGFLGLTILCFVGVGHLHKKLTLPNWFGLPAALVSSMSIFALGLVTAFGAALDSSVPFDSEPAYYTLADDLRCQAQIFGGATVATSRVDILLFQRLFFGIERQVAHQSWLNKEGGAVSLKEACSKLATSQQ